MTMSWMVGRSLSQITKSNKTYSFKYNADGLRTEKKCVTDGNTHHYYYDSNGNMIAFRRNNAAVVYFYYDSQGNVTSMSFEGTKYFFIKNIQGDVEKIVTHQGNVAVTYKYDAWGKLISKTDNTVYGIGELNPFRYRGYIYDDETGLYYLKSRYYDPVTGRFINEDIYSDTKSGSPLSVNMFTYCENNHINKKDLSGCAFVIDDAIYIIVGVTFFVTAVFAAILSTPPVQKALNDLINSLGEGVKSICDSIAGAIDAALSKAKEKGKKNDKYEVHHIVAKKAPRAKPARALLNKAKIKIESKKNKVRIKYSLHRRLHTNAYYDSVNTLMKKGKGKPGKTELILKYLKELLKAASKNSP